LSRIDNVDTAYNRGQEILASEALIGRLFIGLLPSHLAPFHLRSGALTSRWVYLYSGCPI